MSIFDKIQQIPFLPSSNSAGESIGYYKLCYIWLNRQKMSIFSAIALFVSILVECGD